MKDSANTRWSDTFGRSSDGRAVWFDRKGLGSDVQGGVEKATGGRMYASSGIDIAFADGGSTFEFPYGFTQQGRAGYRVHGWASMRYLCHVNRITPPTRRLAGEPFLPDGSLVAEAVVIQLADHRETLVGPEWLESTLAGKEPTPIQSLPPQARSFWELLADLHGMPTRIGT